jgi:hypothetical protein
MLVQYHDRFDVVAEFDPGSGRIRVMPRPPGTGSSATDGWFAILSGACVVFYRWGEQLWLRVGDRSFDLDAGASVSWRVEGGEAVLVVVDGGGQVVLRYTPGPLSGPPLSEDPTPFIEKEDWDLGLFVANVMSDVERRNLVRNPSS